MNKVFVRSSQSAKADKYTQVNYPDKITNFGTKVSPFFEKKRKKNLQTISSRSKIERTVAILDFGPPVIHNKEDQISDI